MSEIVNQFTEAQLPPSAVDVAGAIRAGRRRRQLRTGLAAAAAVVALAAGAATAPALLSAPGPQPPAEPPCGSSEPARPTMPTWQQFDPLTLEIDASDVTGYGARVTATTTYLQFVNLGSVNSADAEPGPVTIFLYACGGEPHHFAGEEAVPFDPASGEPADPIGGAPAYWVPPNSPFLGGAQIEGLAWQWTPGAWVIVVAGPEADPGEADASTVDTAGLRAVATQVSHQVRLGVGTPVTAPFSMPVPDGTYPSFTLTTLGRDSGESVLRAFTIGFSAFGTEEPTHLPSENYVPTFTVDADATGLLIGTEPPTTATEYPGDLGYPAFQDVNDGMVSLLVYDVLGLIMRITPGDLPGTSDEHVALAADVFGTITVYPGASDDLAAWGDPIATDNASS